MFPTVAGKTYTLWQNDTPTTIWLNTGLSTISGDGSTKQFSISTPVIGIPKRFYRVQVGP